MSASISSPWPSTPLDAAEKAFLLMTERPTHVPFAARSVDGLPDRILPLNELRRPVLAANTSFASPRRGVPGTNRAGRPGRA